MQGIEEAADLPPALTVDPHELSEAERSRLGVVKLPATLDEAFANLEADTGALAPDAASVFVWVWLDMQGVH